MKMEVFVELISVGYAIGCSNVGHVPLITISGTQIYMLHFEDEIDVTDNGKTLLTD